jgi:hypothetical protein
VGARLAPAGANLAPPLSKSRSLPSATVATKSTAVAKAQATREARHTMGKNQKKAITGTVTPTTPVTTGSTTPQNGAGAVKSGS